MMPYSCQAATAKIQKYWYFLLNINYNRLTDTLSLKHPRIAVHRRRIRLAGAQTVQQVQHQPLALLGRKKHLGAELLCRRKTGTFTLAERAQLSAQVVAQSLLQSGIFGRLI